MIETLITSSVLIIGVCLLRVLLKGKTSPGLLYAVWGIVALRLVMPWFVPVFGWLGRMKSSLSVMNAAEVIREHAVTGTVLEPLANNLSTGVVTQANLDGLATAGRAVTKSAAVDWQLVILMIWGVGGLLLFVWMVCTNLHFARRLFYSRERYHGDTEGLTELPVYCVPFLKSPCFLVYLRDRAIYIPKEMAGDRDRLRHVLVHENCHARHYDHIWGGLRCILLCYYWINPLVWVAAFLSKRDCELACDAAAIRFLGEKERFSYGNTLLTLASRRGNLSEFFCLSPDMGHGKRAMKERITILAGHPHSTLLTVLILVMAVMGLVACTYTGRKNQEDMRARAEQWAEAFCDRDGQALMDMYDPEHLAEFYQMDQVYSEEGDAAISFGMSSPWPMDHQYKILIDGTQADIIYYAMTSDPHRWLWRETLEWKKVKGVWLVSRVEFTDYDAIQSAAQFQEAYADGIAGTPMDYRLQGFGEALNTNAIESDAYRDLFDPWRAMEYLLNLHGGVGTAVKQGQTTVAVYTFPDGSQAAVTMIQPFGKDGIWIPEKITEVPETAETITADDVLQLAGMTDQAQMRKRIEAFPQPDRVMGQDEKDVLNQTKCYDFLYAQESYELQLSFGKQDGRLEDIMLIRQATGEAVFLYPGNEPDVRRFLDTHAGMTDYLSFRLPDGLTAGGYVEGLGNDGGSLFFTDIPEYNAHLEELSQYTDPYSIPATWLAAGAQERYTGGWPDRRFEQGNLLQVEIPWNHSSYMTEPISIADCEAPALLIKVSHDLYTPSSLADAEALHGPIPPENQTSRMWYLFFAKPDSQELYSISLNADLYDEDEVLQLAGTVHFTGRAWEEIGTAAGE